MRFDLVTAPYAKSANPLEPYRQLELPGVMVRGDWSSELSDYYQEKRIEALYLNVSQGWSGRDYSFLKEIPLLRLLHVIASRGDNLSAIGHLINLEELSLTCPNKDKVDFTKLSSLRRCFLEWWNGASSILECQGLESLYLHKLPVNKSAGLKNLGKLRDLTIYSQSMSSLEPLTGLGNLEKLELLAFRKLQSLDGIENLTALRSLTLNGCSLLSDLSPLAALRNLEHLVVSDWKSIDTVAPLRALQNLRALALSGERCKISDGDLSPLEALPKLSMLMFGARRHYSHKIVKPWNWGNFDRPDTLLQRK